jgi:endonuclease III
MKDSKKYSQRIRELQRSFKSGYQKCEKVVYDEPVEAIIYAIVSERISENKTKTAIKKFTDNFVGFNDLRVSRPEEIIEVLGENTPVTREIASTLLKFLTAVFNKYNMVTFKALKKIGKRPAKQTLEKIEGISRFSLDYCMLTSLNGHSIPLTEKMMEYLKSNELVHPEADEQQVCGFLARQISAKNAYQFYALLRSKSEARRARTKARKKTTRKTKARPKAKTRKKTKRSKK